MNELTQRAQRYLNQLEPHQLGWEGPQIIEELLSTINAGGQETSGGSAAEARNSRIGSNPVPPAPDTAAPRPCTCHPEDKPPTPCAKQYALHECLRFHASRLERERDEAYNAGIEAAAMLCDERTTTQLGAVYFFTAIRKLKKGA
jgi:hypothetical protein